MQREISPLIPIVALIGMTLHPLLQDRILTDYRVLQGIRQARQGHKVTLHSRTFLHLQESIGLL